MAENQPEVAEDQGGEPAPESKPELMGYKSVEDLVAAKVASDQEAKRIIEERDALRARLAEQESRTDQPPADRANGQGEQDEAYWADVESFAQKGDPVARGMIAERNERERMAYAMSATYELLDIDDREERRAVAKHLQRNANRNLDVRAARSEVRALKLDKEHASLAEENARLKAELEASKKKPPTDVIRTAGREITADKITNGVETMTQSEYDRRIAELKQTGQHKEALRMSQRLTRDEIAIRWGQ